MKKLIPILLLILAIPSPVDFKIQDRPIIKVDSEDRVLNWTGWNNEGSCVHASMMMLFGYQGRDDWADFWGENYESGYYHSWLINALEVNEIPYASTYERNNVEFLEWAITEKLGCIVTTGIRGKDGKIHWGNHMILLVHLDNSEAAIIDPNYPTIIKWMDREKFLKNWFLSNSWATTVLLKTPRTP